MKHLNSIKAVSLIGGLAVLGGFASIAHAHHSYAMFDNTKRVTLAGTVVKFNWTNPHVSLDLDVPTADGAVKTYTIECASPNVLSRRGWKFNTIKVGDKVSLLINPLRDGRDGGQLEEATVADGRTLSNSNPPTSSSLD